MNVEAVVFTMNDSGQYHIIGIRSGTPGQAKKRMSTAANTSKLAVREGV